MAGKKGAAKGKGKAPAKVKNDWGDGKAHTVSKRDHEAHLQAHKAGLDPGLYDTALDMATQSFAPAIRSVQTQSAALAQHVAPGGTFDQAFDRSGGAINASQQAAAAFGTQQAADVKSFGQMGVDASAQLGAEQVARAQEAQRLYGATAQAAEEAATRQGAATSSQGAAAANMGGYLGALNAANVNLAPSLMAGNEAHRGEGRVQLGAQANELVGKLADLRSQRGQQAMTTATGMAKDLRDYQLARDTLGQKGTDSLRDYRSTMAGIREQGRQADIRDANDDASRATTNKNSDEDRKAALERAKLGQQPTPLDLARYDVNKNGRLDPGEAAALNNPGGKSKGATIYAGRDGHAIDVSPSVRASQVAARKRIGKYMDLAVQGLGSGRYKTADEFMKAKSLKDRNLAELAMSYAAARQHGDTTPIDRHKFLSTLQAMFYMGEIPTDLSKLIDPK